ncbi:hypothetical protein [Streptomyces enissocaesilis]
MPKKPAPNFGFPPDLRKAQSAPHQARAQYEKCARTLPWPAEPIPGQESE